MVCRSAGLPSFLFLGNALWPAETTYPLHGFPDSTGMACWLFDSSSQYCGWTKSCTTFKKGKPVLVGNYRGIIIPVILGWCRISSIYSMSRIPLPNLGSTMHVPLAVAGEAAAAAAAEVEARG